MTTKLEYAALAAHIYNDQRGGGGAQATHEGVVGAYRVHIFT